MLVEKNNVYVPYVPQNLGKVYSDLLEGKLISQTVEPQIALRFNFIPQENKAAAYLAAKMLKIYLPLSKLAIPVDIVKYILNFSLELEQKDKITEYVSSLNIFNECCPILNYERVSLEYKANTYMNENIFKVVDELDKANLPKIPLCNQPNFSLTDKCKKLKKNTLEKLGKR